MITENLAVDWEINIQCRPNNYPIVQIHDEQGGKMERPVAPEELVRLLSQSEIVTSKWRDIPILPKNCIRYAEEAYNKNVYKLLLLLPAQNHDIWLFEQKIKGVAFPTLLFGFVVQGYRIKEKYVVALKDELVTDETPLYKYPYSNVYEDAKACWRELPDISEPRELRTIPELFFACPDTTHLYGGREQNKSKLPYRDLLLQYQNKAFPINILVPRHETLREFWERL